MRLTTTKNRLRILLRTLRRLSAAYAGQLREGSRLPPGRLRNLHHMEADNQRAVLECIDRHGPIFKAWQDRSVVICVAGLDRIRRLIAERESMMRPVSVPFAAPFPIGLIRVMEGENHTKYRGQLIAALQPEEGILATDSVDAMVRSEMLATKAGADAHQQIDHFLFRVATGLLIQMFFGFQPGSRAYEELMQRYHRLGPDGYVMQVGPEQHHAFEEIHRYLHDPAGAVKVVEGCVLGRLAATDGFDEVSLGNLIYMVEIGRSDLVGLFRWMLNYAAYNPDIQDQIASATAEDKRQLSMAFVHETLRLNQIERLLRSVQQPFSFDGFYFPKHARVRLCLWESHKSEEVFDQPFAFDLQRFMTKDAHTLTLPFGIGKHRCPMATYNLQIGARFISALVTNYRIKPLSPDNPHRGRHHWEPAAQFGVSFIARASAAS